MRNAIRDFGPPAVLLGALLVGFSGLVRAPGSLIVDGDRPWIDEGSRGTDRPIGNDLTGLFLPRFLWQAELWNHSGTIPQWDPRGFAGRPNVGNPQAGPWYPPAWISWAWGDPAALGWLTVAHLYGMGMGTFVLGRTIGLGRSAATASGAVLMLNPYVIAQVHEGHLPHVWSASWSPWAFLGAALIGKGSGLGWLVLPPSLALSMMTGHPQAGAYLALALIGWGLIDGAGTLVRDRSARKRDGMTRFGRGAVAIALAAGLSAVEWVPVLRAMPWAVGSIDGAGGGSSSPYHLDPSNLFQLISPRALGGPAEYFGRGNQWESMLSIGWAALAMAVLGAATHPDRRKARMWLVLLIGSLWFASGPSLGLSTLVGKMPGMGAVRVPGRSLFLAAMAGSMLSGMGIDALSRGTDQLQAVRWVRRYGVIVGLLALSLLAGVLVGSFREGDRSVGQLDRWSLASGRIATDPVTIASVVAVGAIFAARIERPGFGSRAMVIVVVLELALSAAIALPISRPERFLEPDAVSKALDRSRPDGSFRVRSRDAFYSDLDAWRDGVEKVNIGDRFQPRASAELVRTLYPLFDEPGSRPLDVRLARAVLDRIGCARIISDRPLRMTIGPGLISGNREGSRFDIIANPNALPRGRIVPKSEIVATSQTLERLAEVDPQSLVIMHTDPLREVDPARRQAFTEAEYLQEHPDRVIVRSTTEAPGLLVIADTWMPGWSATVNGRSAPVLRGDHAFRVIPLPDPGTLEVVLTYRAPGLRLGSGLTLGSTVALVLIWLRSSRQAASPKRG